MRKGWRWVAAALAALAIVAAGAGAAAGLQAIPVLKVGDTVDVLGTKIACFAVRASGKDGFGCFEADSKGLIAKTYGVAIAEDGTVTINRVNADGSTTRVYRHTPRPLLPARAGKYVKLGPGRAFTLSGTSLICEILKITDPAVPALYRGTKVACYLARASGPKPNTYGVAVSNRFAGVYRITAAGKPGADVAIKKQP